MSVRHTTVDRYNQLVDIASVVLISIATVATAWCGYESARWSGLQAECYSRANAYRIKSAEMRARADDERLLDVALFVQFAGAYFGGKPEFAKFLLARMRPELKPAINAWIALRPLKNPQAPQTPFSMPQYRVAAAGEAATLEYQAGRAFESAVAATRTGDGYVLLTVLYSSVMFLGGVGAKLRHPLHLMLLTLGFVVFVFATVLLTKHPVY